jgi:hypothetical protein
MVIGSLIERNTNILDLGCGHKDLLKFVNPRRYLGIDYESGGDLQMNFNLDFVLPEGPWNYIVCSGLLEYIEDVPKFINTIKNQSDYYIITYWSKNRTLRQPNRLPNFSIENFVDLMNCQFDVIEIRKWKNHQIFLVKDKL